jgi:pyruvate ferredoxin oxidoreductase gamma subunit
MSQLTEIRWHGRGGQGVVTAGELLAETALDMGQYFQAFPDYGPERMGAPVRAFTRISSDPIDLHCQIEAPDIVLVLDPTLLGTVDVTEGLKQDGLLLVNTTMNPAEIREMLGMKTTGRVLTLDASRIAMEEIGREITNTPMLGALVKATGMFKLNDLIEQTRHRFTGRLRPELVEANVRAVQRAADEVQEG